MNETTDHEQEEYRYPGCKVGRRRRTVEGGGPDAEPMTLAEGKLGFHTDPRENLLESRPFIRVS